MTFKPIAQSPHVNLIDGRAAAAKLKESLKPEVDRLKAAGVTPGLAVVLVGEDAASQVYVKNKAEQTKQLGMHSVQHRLHATTTQEELLALVGTLNADSSIHGILVQLPLPKHISEPAVLAAIHPDKDVDGFHVVNAGQLAVGEPRLVPCTPLGCIHLLKGLGINLRGLHAVVIGRSNIVGKPMAQLLLQEDCTVTIVHSRTPSPELLVKQADIVVAAVGRPRMVKADWLKPGAIVIDVGINRIEENGEKKIVGDVDFAEAQFVASAITPVPGGVGPMTIACLLANTVRAAALQHKL
jgi:methylenetetrahydrofolate dehydrogenase (NADP+)/methenyltetrahydrofolate cyclohydrolase